MRDPCCPLNNEMPSRERLARSLFSRVGDLGELASSRVGDEVGKSYRRGAGAEAGVCDVRFAFCVDPDVLMLKGDELLGLRDCSRGYI